LSVVVASRFSVAHLRALVVERHPLRLALVAFVKASDWQAGHKEPFQAIFFLERLFTLACAAFALLSK
jgi:hypothetical protein